MVPAITASCGVPRASTTRLRLSHPKSNETQHSLPSIGLLNNRYQLLEWTP